MQLLSEIAFAKFVHRKGLRLNSSSETGYGFFSFLKEQKPRYGRGFAAFVCVFEYSRLGLLFAQDIWFVLMGLNDLS